MPVERSRKLEFREKHRDSKNFNMLRWDHNSGSAVVNYFNIQSNFRHKFK